MHIRKAESSIGLNRLSTHVLRSIGCLGILLLAACGGGGGGSGGGSGNGPSQVDDPNVQGDTQAAATAAITAAGLTVGTITMQSSSTVAAGSVISESPVGGTDVSRGSVVNLVVSSGPAPVSTPDVVGDTQATATTAITTAGLAVGTVTQQSSNVVTSGNVISETPAAGTMVTSGSAVNLVVSTGAAQVAVPNVAGETQAAAATTIALAGLIVGTPTYAFSTSSPAGAVAGSLPNPGTEVAPGSTVSIVISIGSTGVNVPNVVGDTATVAAAAIINAHLVVGKVSQQSSSAAAGSVISETPPAGTEFAPGWAINLVLSSGTSQVAVPNVVGDTQASATTAITGAGLVLGTVTQTSSSTVPAGQVTSETPVAGTSVGSGASVNLVVSSGATQAPGETVLHIFGSGADGATPDSVIQGKDGNFYGVTTNGGTYGYGTVFEITPAGVETVLYSFGATVVSGGFFDDGESPSGIMQANDGNFYVTCEGGGKHGYGSIVKLTPAGAESLLYSFSDGSDGGYPTGALTQATDGNFYGTASAGGASGQGAVFKMSPSGSESAIYSFTAGADGSSPIQGLIQATDGNLYGITYGSGANGWGTVFRVTLAGSESVVYAFTNGSEGSFPRFGVIQGTDGNLYGMTEQGGQYFQNGGGTLFKLTLGGALTVVHSFGAQGDANLPFGALVQGRDGSFYGTTTTDSTTLGKGTVFKVTPTGVETILYSFNGGAQDGDEPGGPLIQGNDGALYGTTQFGGSSSGLGSGVVFKIVL